jgi:hypothetical protein
MLPINVQMLLRSLRGSPLFFAALLCVVCGSL